MQPPSPRFEGEGRDEAQDSCLVVVAVSGSEHAAEVIDASARLAASLAAPLDAVCIESPDDHDRQRKARLAETLSKAQELGATVAKVPAPTVADGLVEHLRSTGATHLVLGLRPRSGIARLMRRSLVDELIRRGAEAELLLVPDRSPARPVLKAGFMQGGSVPDYLIALAGVALTVLVAAFFRMMTSIVSTSILFLFPVIAVAARSGLGPTLFAVAASVVSYNILFLQPSFGFNPWAIQSWIMTAVLLVVGCYTSMLTSSLRGRARLSDRSARESASLASFAQRLTRIADWTGTGAAVCEEVSLLLDVDTVIFREIGGKLEKVADYPAGARLEPLDQMALEWAWEKGEKSGMGTPVLQAASWQFHPLATSLGVLAVIGLARPDSGLPITPDQSVLLSTLLAQASLAHERLRLEDQMRVCPDD